MKIQFLGKLVTVLSNIFFLLGNVYLSEHLEGIGYKLI